MAKPSALLKKILEKSGRYDAEKHEKLLAAIDEVEGELDDTDVNITVNTLLTESEAKTKLGDKLKESLTDDLVKRGRAEAYDGIDKSVLPEFEVLLSGESKLEYDKLKSTPQKVAFIGSFLQKRATGGADAETYKKELTKLRAEMDTKFVSKDKYDEVFGSVESAKKKALESQLAYHAKTSDKVADESKKARRFQENFIADCYDILAKEKQTVDYETGKIMTIGENPTFVLKDGTSEPMTIQDLVDKTATTIEEYTKKSGGGSGGGNIDVNAGGDEDLELSHAQRRNMASFQGA